MADELRNQMRRERARLEREERERGQAMRDAREQAERDHFAPLLAAQNPIRLLVVYTKTETGYRAEAVGLGNACEASTKERARKGLHDLVRRRAHDFPREVLEATQKMATAEVVELDIKAASGRRGRRSR